MTNLEEKKIKWSDKLREGDKKYLMIARVDNEWYFVGNKHAEPILSLKIAVDCGAGLQKEYVYSIDRPDTDGLAFTAWIKDESKILIEDRNGLVAFGIKDVASPAAAILIYLRTENIHTFIFGCQKSCSVSMFHAMALEQYDAVTYVMDDIFAPQDAPKIAIKVEEETAHET